MILDLSLRVRSVKYLFLELRGGQFQGQWSTSAATTQENTRLTIKAPTSYPATAAVMSAPSPQLAASITFSLKLPARQKHQNAASRLSNIWPVPLDLSLRFGSMFTCSVNKTR